MSVSMLRSGFLQLLLLFSGSAPTNVDKFENDVFLKFSFGAQVSRQQKSSVCSSWTKHLRGDDSTGRRAVQASFKRDKWFTRLTAEYSFTYLAINNVVQSEPPLEICLLLCVYSLFIH